MFRREEYCRRQVLLGHLLMCQKPAESDISCVTAIFFPKRLLRLELRNSTTSTTRSVSGSSTQQLVTPVPPTDRLSECGRKKTASIWDAVVNRKVPEAFFVFVCEEVWRTGSVVLSLKKQWIETIFHNTGDGFIAWIHLFVLSLQLHPPCSAIGL